MFSIESHLSIIFLIQYMFTEHIVCQVFCVLIITAVTYKVLAFVDFSISHWRRQTIKQ